MIKKLIAFILYIPIFVLVLTITFVVMPFCIVMDWAVGAKK